MPSPKQFQINEIEKLKRRHRELMSMLQDLIDEGNLIVYDKESRVVSEVESFTFNGPAVQFNLKSDYADD